VVAAMDARRTTAVDAAAGGTWMLKAEYD
jgi:hypothetical protein